MTELINEFRLISNQKTILDDDDRYIVPLYQRAYAWKEKEIEQLIDDINDINDDTYYLGSLVVYKKKNMIEKTDNNEKTVTLYEVIDGQQRLTTLYILFSFLKLVNNDNLTLSFECRDKSNYTLSHLTSNEVEESMIETQIVNGIRIIEDKFKKEDIDVNMFVEKLSRVIIYRIEVPKNTDLNRYFEIMNTRGEQLEQHDILKASLMKYLNNQSEKNSFALIWDACADMSGYVQMHFCKKNREELFGGGWNCLCENPFSTLSNIESLEHEKSLSIKDLLNSSYKYSNENDDGDNEDRIRFESIIDFSYFLQHVLKVYVKTKNLAPDNLVSELLDDKKLLDNFKNVIDCGRINNTQIDKHDFAIDFINLLLLCRFKFDMYILKREYPLNDKEGVWSIKSIGTSGQQKQKKPYYFNTKFHNSGEWIKTYENRNKLNVMIQSCLRVSYTSPKNMHWITSLLCKLYYSTNEESLAYFNEAAEALAKEATLNQFIIPCENNGNYHMGVNTPHIALNYLDYLIWKSNPNKYNDFIFEFRNTVEHWYPQHPSDGTFPIWDQVDRFGNVCIIQRNINSKFSNMAPEAKKSTFKEMISKGSLKLRIMSDKTMSTMEWTNEICNAHEIDMLKVLKDDIFNECN